MVGRVVGLHESWYFASSKKMTALKFAREGSSSGTLRWWSSFLQALNGFEFGDCPEEKSMLFSTNEVEEQPEFWNGTRPRQLISDSGKACETISMIQALAACPPLASICANMEGKSVRASSELEESLLKLFRLVRGGGGVNETRIVLRSLPEELSSENVQNLLEYICREGSELRRVFGFYEHTEGYCNECPRLYAGPTNFASTISVVVPSSGEGMVDIAQLLGRKYMESHKPCTGSCSGQVSETTGILLPPNVLTISLNRSSSTSTEENKTQVFIPEKFELDVHPGTGYTSLNNTYTLTSFVSQTENGQHFAICRYDSKWYLCTNELVEEVCQEQLTEYANRICFATFCRNSPVLSEDNVPNPALSNRPLLIRPQNILKLNTNHPQHTTTTDNGDVSTAEPTFSRHFSTANDSLIGSEQPTYTSKYTWTPHHNGRFSPTQPNSPTIRTPPPKPNSHKSNSPTIKTPPIPPPKPNSHKSNSPTSQTPKCRKRSDDEFSQAFSNWKDTIRKPEPKRVATRIAALQSQLGSFLRGPHSSSGCQRSSSSTKDSTPQPKATPPPFPPPVSFVAQHAFSVNGLPLPPSTPSLEPVQTVTTSAAEVEGPLTGQESTVQTANSETHVVLEHQIPTISAPTVVRLCEQREASLVVPAQGRYVREDSWDSNTSEGSNELVRLLEARQLLLKDLFALSPEEYYGGPAQQSTGTPLIPWTRSSPDLYKPWKHLEVDHLDTLLSVLRGNADIKE